MRNTYLIFLAGTLCLAEGFTSAAQGAPGHGTASMSPGSGASPDPMLRTSEAHRTAPSAQLPAPPPPLPQAPVPAEPTTAGSDAQAATVVPSPLAGAPPVGSSAGAGESPATTAAQDDARSFFWPPIVVIATPALAVTSLLAFLHLCKTAKKNLAVTAARNALLSINFAPILCTFFVASAMVISKGTTEDTAKPQDTSMGVAVYACALSFVVQAVLRICFEYLVLTQSSSRLGLFDHTSTDNAPGWRASCQVSVAAMYGFIVLAMVSLLDYALTDTSVACTVVLAVSYFAVYLALHIAVFDADHAFVTVVLKLAALNLSFAPMFGTLFMAVQVLHDERGGEVPAEIKAGMRMVTAMFLAQTTLAALTPLICDGELEEVGQPGQEDIVIKNRARFRVVSTFRWLLMLVMYASVWGVFSEIWAKRSSGHQVTLLCGLSMAYFAYSTMILVLMSLVQLDCHVTELLHWLIDMKDIIALIPILSALVLGWWYCDVL